MLSNTILTIGRIVAILVILSSIATIAYFITLSILAQTAGFALGHVIATMFISHLMISIVGGLFGGTLAAEIISGVLYLIFCLPPIALYNFYIYVKNKNSRKLNEIMYQQMRRFVDPQAMLDKNDDAKQDNKIKENTLSQNSVCCHHRNKVLLLRIAFGRLAKNATFFEKTLILSRSVRIWGSGKREFESLTRISLLLAYSPPVTTAFS